MRVRTRWMAAIGFVVIVVAGCGGGASSAPSQGASTAPSQGTAPSAAPSEGGASVAPSEGTTPSEAASAGPSAGGNAGLGACELVTAAEAGDILGMTVDMQVLPGMGGIDTCDIQSDGSPVAAFVLTRSDPASGLVVSAIYAAYEMSTTWIDVPGLGDKAGFDETQSLLVVLKGDAMISISVFDDGISEADRLEMMKQLGAVAATRM